MARFHYVLRPAKHVERLMIVEACRRLNTIAPLSTYEYVGFGSLEFADFRLFHCQLGIRNMTSIEQDQEWHQRYEFNKPYKSVRVLIGKASQYLPQLDWGGLRIVWLDYECQLTEECIRDTETVMRSLHQGSVLIVTVQAAAPYQQRLTTLQANMEADRIPLDIDEAALQGQWGFATAQHRIVSNALSAVAAARVDGAQLSQLLNFHYADNAKMQTIGWLVTSEALAQQVSNCHFEQLSFIRSGADAFLLRVPVLTAKEVSHLNAKLPLKGKVKLKLSWIDMGTLADYPDIYRYYPAFLPGG